MILNDDLLLQTYIKYFKQSLKSDNFEKNIPYSLNIGAYLFNLKDQNHPNH